MLLWSFFDKLWLYKISWEFVLRRQTISKSPGPIVFNDSGPCPSLALLSLANFLISLVWVPSIKWGKLQDYLIWLLQGVCAVNRVQALRIMPDVGITQEMMYYHHSFKTSFNTYHLYVFKNMHLVQTSRKTPLQWIQKHHYNGADNELDRM